MYVMTGKKSVKPLFSRVRVVTCKKSLFLTYACHDVRKIFILTYARSDLQKIFNSHVCVYDLQKIGKLTFLTHARSDYDKIINSTDSHFYTPVTDSRKVHFSRLFSVISQIIRTWTDVQIFILSLVSCCQAFGCI